MTYAILSGCLLRPGDDEEIDVVLRYLVGEELMDSPLRGPGHDDQLALVLVPHHLAAPHHVGQEEDVADAVVRAGLPQLLGALRLLRVQRALDERQREVYKRSK